MTEINPNTKNAAEQLIQRVANPVKERDVWFHSEIKDRRSGLSLKAGIYRSRDLPNDAWTYVLDRQVAIKQDDGSWTTRWQRAIMTDAEMLDYLGKQLNYLNRFSPISGKKQQS